jgi:hypothetical protein
MSNHCHRGLTIMNLLYGNGRWSVLFSHNALQTCSVEPSLRWLIHSA